MFCSKCGFDLPDYANFCLNCGLSLKNPVPAQKKRVGITEQSGTVTSIWVSSTEKDIVDWTKQRFISMNISLEHYDQIPKGSYSSEIPGRFYFITDRPMFFAKKSDSDKINLLKKLLKEKLVTEGWKIDPHRSDYTKEF